MPKLSPRLGLVGTTSLFDCGLPTVLCGFASLGLLEMQARRAGICATWHAFATLSIIALACLASSANDDCSLLNSFLQSSGMPMRNCCLQEARVNCSYGNFIFELRLDGLNLSGNIPNGTLGALRNLTLLDLSRNNLSGDVPPDVWNSSRLQYLNLSANKFSGSVFSALWSLANQTYVNLSSNGFHSQNHSAGQSSRGGFLLQTLDLSANLIAGSLRENLCSLFANLTVLNISSNRLQSGNFSQCTNLQVFNASFNQLHGTLLPDIFQATSLRILDLTGNNLNGTIPTTLRRLRELAILDLSFNNLTGQFFADEMLPNLTSLNISYNDLTVDVNRRVVEMFGESAFTNNTEIVCADCYPVPSPAPSTFFALSPQSAPSPFFALLPKFSPSPVVRKSRLVVGAGAIAGIAVGGVVGIIAIIVVSVIVRKKRRRTKWVLKPLPFRVPPDRHLPEIGPFSFESDSGTWVANVKDPTAVKVIIFEKPLLNLTFADLLYATSSFARAAEVGDGSGLAYKCVLPGVLSGEGSVAIKVVEEGQNWKREEAVPALEAIGKMKHENLVPLLGYCIVGEEKLLIYKYMEGGSLEEVLHALPGGVLDMDKNCNLDWEQAESGTAEEGNSAGLSWARRVEIAVGTARALSFLHHGWAEQVVHGGVSGDCILLEESGEARLANYGGEARRSRGNEAGYAAPECMGGEQEAGKATARSDVYSFGVVLLELATGKRAAGDLGHGYTSLAAWVRQLTKEKRAARAVDPKLAADGGFEEHVLEMIKIGYLCTAESAAKRPSMQQVLGLLKDLSATSSAASASSAAASASS